MQLSRLKGLRGTALDLPSYTAERRMERRLIGEYQDLILSLVETVTDVTLPTATELAGAASAIAGYGAVKEAGVGAYSAQVAQLLESYERAPSVKEAGLKPRQGVPADS